MKKILLFLIIGYFLYAQGLYTPAVKPIYQDTNYYMLSIREDKQFLKLLKSNNTKEIKKFLTQFKGKNLYRPLKLPITYLSQLSSKVQNIKNIKILLENGSNPDATSISGWKYPYTSIIPAIGNNDFKTIQLLLDYNASLNYTNKKLPINCGSFAPHIPIFEAKTKKMVNFLIEKGADIKRYDSKGYTILDYSDLKSYNSKYYTEYDSSLKSWLIDNYNLPTKYFRCGTKYPFNKNIIKVIHSDNGYKEFNENDTLVYEVLNGKQIFPKIN